jgi:hypothetical protein
MNKIKDGYFWAIEAIEKYPHKAFWAFVIVLALLVVFR